MDRDDIKPIICKSFFKYVQCSPFITIYSGFTGMDLVISESCYKGTILQRNYRKMTILWSFSYNSFVKFHGNKIWKLQQARVISKSFCVITRCVIKGMHYYQSRCVIKGMHYYQSKRLQTSISGEKRGSHKLWKSWKTWKITIKSTMHGKIIEFEKNLNNHGKIKEFCEIISRNLQ